MPIGGVIAHETLVSPIGCRLRHRLRQQAVFNDANAADVRANIDQQRDVEVDLAARHGPGAARAEVRCGCGFRAIEWTL